MPLQVHCMLEQWGQVGGRRGPQWGVVTGRAYPAMQSGHAEGVTHQSGCPTLSPVRERGHASSLSVWAPRASETLLHCSVFLPSSCGSSRAMG
jgi:hypothetical protein